MSARDDDTSAGLDDSRRMAQNLYRQGRLAEAASAQSQVLATAQAEGSLQPYDFLFAGLVANEAQRINDAVAILYRGVALYPTSAALQEKLGVMLTRAGDLASAITACETAL